MTELSVNPSTQHIQDLEDQRFDAIVAGDFASFAGLCDERLSYTHSNGVRDTLDSYVDACRDGFYVYHRVEHPVEHILFIGDVALVLGQMRADLTVAGQRKMLDNQSIAVWVRRDDGWRLLAFQGTPIPSN